MERWNEMMLKAWWQLWAKGHALVDSSLGAECNLPCNLPG